jgi:hypothetical protein
LYSITYCLVGEMTRGTPAANDYRLRFLLLN